MTKLLLVSGSRRMANDPVGEAWARALLRRALADVAVLGVGHAEGPDEWAVQEHDGEVLQWRLDGYLWVRHPRRGPEFERNQAWCSADEKETRIRDRFTWPTFRDEKMVEALAEWLPYWPTHGPSPVERAYLGLVDARSVTQGTRNTVRLALEAGLTGVTHTYYANQLSLF